MKFDRDRFIMKIIVELFLRLSSSTILTDIFKAFDLFFESNYGYQDKNIRNKGNSY